MKTENNTTMKEDLTDFTTYQKKAYKLSKKLLMKLTEKQLDDMIKITNPDIVLDNIEDKLNLQFELLYSYVKKASDEDCKTACLS